MKNLSAALGVTLATAVPAAAEMTLSFDWGNIPLCTTGNPGKVANPIFTIKGVPDGTDKLIFKMTDLDVPGYNHGGGTIRGDFSGNIKIAPGAFKYKSPCPPSGRHTYEWRVTAKSKSNTLATAKARRKYPE